MRKRGRWLGSNLKPLQAPKVQKPEGLALTQCPLHSPWCLQGLEIWARSWSPTFGQLVMWGKHGSNMKWKHSISQRRWFTWWKHGIYKFEVKLQLWRLGYIYIYIHIYSPYQLLQDLVVHEWLVIKLIVLQGHMLPSLIRCLHLFHCPTALGWHSHAEQNERLELHKTSRHAVGARCLKLYKYDNILSGETTKKSKNVAGMSLNVRAFLAAGCWTVGHGMSIQQLQDERTSPSCPKQPCIILHVYLTVRQHCKSLLAI